MYMDENREFTDFEREKVGFEVGFESVQRKCYKHTCHSLVIKKKASL